MKNTLVFLKTFKYNKVGTRKTIWKTGALLKVTLLCEIGSFHSSESLSQSLNWFTFINTLFWNRNPAMQSVGRAKFRMSNPAIIRNLKRVDNNPEPCSASVSVCSQLLAEADVHQLTELAMFHFLEVGW